MSNIIKIENQELQIKEFNGQRVVTLKDIDIVHERPKGTARETFNRNKQHFIEGEDFFSISRKELRMLYIRNEKLIGNPNVKMVLLTESGYLMLVKVFNDDLAWKVQRQLVNCYFKVKEEFRDKMSLKSNITFEQTIEMANVIKGTPLANMEYVFKALQVFVPTLEMPERREGDMQKQINRYLKEHDLSINAFCNQTGLAKSNVWNWVNGKTNPSTENIILLRNILG